MNTEEQKIDKIRASKRDYMRRNAKRIAAERAEQLQDPEHAEVVREYFRDYWLKRVSGEHVPWSPPLYHDFDGQRERVYRTSEAARMLFCSTATICQWHKKGWLPDPLLERDRRLYRRYQIDLMGVLLCVKQRDFNTRTQVLEFICAKW